MYSSAKVLSKEDSKFVDVVLQGVKKALFHFKHNNLVIYVVNSFEFFFTYCFNP
jgi:hypothetical protein